LLGENYIPLGFSAGVMTPRGRSATSGLVRVVACLNTSAASLYLFATADLTSSRHLEFYSTLLLSAVLLALSASGSV